FTSDVNGTITGVRYYRGATSNGPHVANLWSNTGTLLATATFANETASGWQQVNFSTAVAITAYTTYVVSYYAPNGNYAVNNNYFTTGLNTPPLHAPADSASSHNGVYHYGSSGFPSSSWSASNYWVDVVFVTSSAVTVPTITSLTQAAA